MNHIRPLLLILLLCAVACGGESPETRIRKTVEAASEASAARDLDSLMTHVDEAFADAGGRDKQALRALVASHLERHGAVYVWTREQELEVAGDGTARYKAVVALAGRPINTRINFTAFDGDVLRVDLKFKRSGETWKVVGADWEPARPTDLL
ncbi:hypothetical protein ABI59_08085 [Acidobacteria bacterium Mor1]|nr:hypothetical protein ABI59_08085 [Acidobacteria bacterium Mor1]